jgi:hypothetical protein
MKSYLRICFATIAMAVVMSARATVALAAGPDIAEIAAAAKQTAAKLATTGASWETLIVRPQATVHVRIVRSPTMKKTRITIEPPGGAEQPIAQIIERDGFWYVTQQGQRLKNRAYETPFQLATVPALLAMAELRFAASTDPAAYGTFESAEGTLATYRAPLPPQARTQAASAVADARRVGGEKFEKFNPELRATMEALSEMLEHGIPTRVDVDRGLVVYTSSPQLTVSTIDFRWMDPVPASEFDVSGNWEDNTSDPTAGDLNSLAMLQHAGTWQPGMATPDTETRLVDLTTGKIRRVPFRDGMCGLGCFSKDRLSVIVSAMDPTTSVMGLYQINLRTGENKRLGGTALATGITMGAALSPDGTRVVVSHKDGNESILRWRIAVVNLQTNETKLIGEAMDVAFLSWAPDGQSIVLLRREDNGDPNKVPDSTIVRMDLSGNLTPVRRGRDPVVLGDGRILFLDTSDSLWKTCAITGEDVKTVGDGLKDYFFPSPSPDGKRLMMMHKNTSTPTAAPTAEIIDLATGAATPLKLPAGLWTMPSWK